MLLFLIDFYEYSVWNSNCARLTLGLKIKYCLYQPQKDLYTDYCKKIQFCILVFVFQHFIVITCNFISPKRVNQLLLLKWTPKKINGSHYCRNCFGYIKIVAELQAHNAIIKTHFILAYGNIQKLNKRRGGHDLKYVIIVTSMHMQPICIKRRL